MEVIVGKRVTVIMACNEKGKRIGERHHNAKISDATVDLIRELHEDFGLGYLEICQKLKLALGTVRKICTYERRAQTPSSWKRRKIEVTDSENRPIEKVTYVWGKRKYVTYRVSYNTRIDLSDL